MALLIGACSTQPTLKENYQQIDRESKDRFLLYYPYLNHEQRLAYLEDPSSVEQLISSFKVHHSTLLGLFIDPTFDEPLTQGQELPLTAYLQYADNRRVDVTKDVEWKISPSLGKIENSIFHYGCVSNEITVSANFLDELEGSTVIPIKKSVETLKLQVTESYSQTHKYEYANLTLTAICKDHSTTNVTCQADWNIIASQGRISGCGYLTPSQQSFLKRKITANVSYGGAHLIQDIPLPSELR